MTSMANESNIYSRPLAFDSEGMSSISFWFSDNLALIFIWFIFRNRCRFHLLWKQFWFHWRHHYRFPFLQRDCMKWMDHLFHCLTDSIVIRYSYFHNSSVVWSVNFVDLQDLNQFIQFHGNYMKYSKESDGLRSVRHIIAIDMILLKWLCIWSCDDLCSTLPFKPAFAVETRMD